MYYGEWLPNTYYAVFVRPWYEAGFRYYLAAAVDTGLYLLVPLAFLTLRARWRSRRDIAYALPLLCIFVHMFGVMRVGGDNFEYRPLDFYWPVLSVPVSAAILDLGYRVSSARLLQRFVRPGSVRAANAWSLVIFAPVLFYCSAIQGVLLLAGTRIVDYTAKLHIELNDRNTGRFLDVPGIAVLVPISNDLRRLAVKQHIALTFAEHRTFANERIQKWKHYKNMERGSIPAEALAIDRAIGIPYYYIPDMKVVDSLGLTDATIARTAVDTPNFARQIAHDRRPPRGYLEERGVNIRVEPPASDESQALLRAPFALKVGADLWMPFHGIYEFNELTVENFSEHSTLIQDVIDFDDLLRKMETPAIQAHLDVYLVDNHIIYYRAKCLEEDIDNFPDDPSKSSRRIFLHVFPVNPDDLPSYRQRHGFDNLDFSFAEYGRENDGSCIAAHRLPNYAIASISTGEFRLDADQFRHIWEGRVNLVGKSRDEKFRH